MSDPVARLNAALEGRYAIARELGEGGMATVYLADDLKHERKVALKVLKPELAAVVWSWSRTGSRSFASGWGIDPSDPVASLLRGRRGHRQPTPVATGN